MSFFKELKEDIVQSVNELGESFEESVVDTDIEKSGALEQEVQEEMDSLLKDEGLLLDVPVADEVPADEPPAEIEEADAEIREEDVSGSESDEAVEEEETDPLKMLEEQLMNEEEQEVSEKMDENMTNDPMEVDMPAMPGMEDPSSEPEMYNSEETTVITKGTTISGGIRSDTSLIVKGVIEGDVECQGKLTVTGRVAGNSTASEIYVNTPRMNGNLVSKGSVKVDVGTVVIGNVSGASVVVAGAVKGDIDVNGPIILDSTAVVQGSIIGKSIQINSGAVVDGRCSLQYADVDLDSFFE